MSSKAQEAKVERSIFGIQIGLLGTWGYNELKLSNAITLRTEVGFDIGIFGGYSYDRTQFIMEPVITLEPRYYYNLEKRIAKHKNIRNNTGNFLTLKASYHPDWFVITNSEQRFGLINQIALIPKWGIRRNFQRHLNFESGVGVGLLFFLGPAASNLPRKTLGIIDLHLRVGYSF